MNLLLVANLSPEHVGAHLQRAAGALGVLTAAVDSRRQSSGPRLYRSFFWRLMGHRPTRLRSFSREVVQACARYQPDLMLVTGQTAVTRSDLQRIRRTGVRCANFVTDDPWNPVHRASWFLEALPAYDWIFSPRTANLDDFHRIGCPNVTYLPFAYCQDFHFRETPATPAEWDRFGCDVAFIGGGDADRYPLMRSLARQGFSIKLYGGYWHRDRALRPLARGFVRGADYRKAVAGAKVNIALVRRANRDDNAMRSYELPAMEASIVAEDTEDHRRLYGRDGAIFVTSPDAFGPAVAGLIADEKASRQLAQTARRYLLAGRHTYGDRLRTILQTMDPGR